MKVEFDAEVFRWDARADSAWFFLALPPHLSADLKELPGPARGFGSLRVRARIGDTVWATSIFAGREAFVLPLKKSVRDAEGLAAGTVAAVELEIIDL